MLSIRLVFFIPICELSTTPILNITIDISPHRSHLQPEIIIRMRNFSSFCHLPKIAVLSEYGGNEIFRGA